MQFSEHFERSEFELDGPMPEDCVLSYEFLCENILESIRFNFNEPMDITSGYRDSSANSAAHGVLHSEHEATADWAAADFQIVSLKFNMRPVFDWIRNSKLPFHQVILEHGTNTDVIHVSWNRTANARQALEGAEHNLSPYKAWPVSEAA